MNSIKSILCKVLLSALALVAAGTVFTACQEEEPPFISLDQDSVVASPDDGRFVIDVRANVSWTASCSASWVKVFGDSGNYKGSFEILIGANKSAGPRTAEVVVSGGGCTAVVSIVQTSGELSLVVPVMEYTAGKDASEVLIKYIVSAEDAVVEAFPTADWLEIISCKDGFVKVGIAENESGEPREAKVKIVATDDNAKSVVCESTIFQAATENILDVLVDSLNVAPAGEVVRIPVVTNSEVSVNCSSDWCSASFSNGLVLVTAQKNETNEARAAFVSVTISSGKGFALSKTIKVKQSPVTIDLGQLTILVPEFRVKAKGAKAVIPFSAKTSVTVRSNVPWCVVSLVDSDIVAQIAENDETSDDREAYVTITTSEGVSGTVHIIQGGTSNSESVEIAVPETEFSGEGGSIRLPFTYDSESISVRVSSDWLEAVIIGDDVEVRALENWSGYTRKGYVVLQTADGTIGVIAVTQTSLQPQFLFSAEELKFTSAAAESYVNLTSTGEWKLNNGEAQLPGWISVEPKSGDGDCIITISVTGNKFATARSVELSFTNIDHKMNAKIAVAQEANPQGISDYKYLGKGYDASENFAEDLYVKASVLDCDAMAADDCISDIINMNQTVEETIRGKTLEEYEKNYSVEAGVTGEVGNKLYCFTGSVKTNFSSKALGSEEHSFITFRHVTKKQILKINENETAATLMDYRSEAFVNDIARLDAESLVKKYGTHVIMGFSTGGVIDYSMAADISKMSASTDLGVAVKAGFEKKAIGKIETEDSFKMFESVQKESNGFETKLLCRGGESQYTSAGFANDAQAASAYENWLASMENSDKWVMVDYEGSQLIPLWEFIEDATKAAAVQTVVQNTLTGTGIKQSSSYRNFEWKFVGVNSYGDYLADPGADDVFNWKGYFNISIDGEIVSMVTEQNFNEVFNYEYGDYGAVMLQDSGFKFRFSDYDLREPTTGVHSLSKFKEHTVEIIFSQAMYSMIIFPIGIVENYKVTLTCPADSNVWSYRDPLNDVHTFSPGSNGKTTVVTTFPRNLGAYANGRGMDCEMVFSVNW